MNVGTGAWYWQVINTSAHHHLTAHVVEAMFAKHGHGSHGEDDDELYHQDMVGGHLDVMATKHEHEKHKHEKLFGFGTGSKKYHMSSSNAVAPEELASDHEESRKLAVPVLY
jgi:hypothetical protein